MSDEKIELLQAQLIDVIKDNTRLVEAQRECL